MYSFLKSVHSFIPYILLFLLMVSILVFTIKWVSKRNFAKGDKMLALFTLIFSHVQFLVGLILYFISPLVTTAFKNSDQIMSNDTYRFYAVEHILTMLLAVIMITLGYRKSKKAGTATAKFRNLTLLYLLGFILMLSRIPWEAWSQ